tara:strand:- start:287 stop:922 length:636 start_codon:yes stop_codon:yes gene_type:complete
MERKNYLVLKFKIMKIIKIISVFFLLTTNVYSSEGENKIVVLVNDKVISNYDIEQRVKVFAIVNQVQITPENGNIITNKIVDELIDDLLKMQKIEEYNIKVNNSDLDKYEDQYFKNIEVNKERIFELMKINKINKNQFYHMLYNEIAWQTLISRLYYRATSVSEEEISELMNKDPNISRKLAEKIIMDKQLALKSSKMLRDLRDEATIEYK